MTRTFAGDGETSRGGLKGVDPALAARGVWLNAGGERTDGRTVNTPELREAVTAMGIDPAWLPDGAVPEVLRYCAGAELGFRSAGGKTVPVKGPAMVAAVMGKGGPRGGLALAAAMALGLGTGENARHSDGSVRRVVTGKADAAAGAYVRLAEPTGQCGVVIVTRTLGDGLAVLAAVRGPERAAGAVLAGGLPGVWCCPEKDSTGKPATAAGRRGGAGAMAYAKPPAGEKFRALVLACPLGDGVGEAGGLAKAAQVLGEVWGVPVFPRTPSHALAPELVIVDEGGSERAADKGLVDWVRVLKVAGPERVGAVLLDGLAAEVGVAAAGGEPAGGLPMESASGGGGGGAGGGDDGGPLGDMGDDGYVRHPQGGLILRHDALLLARAFLETEFWPADEAHPQLVYWAGKWYGYHGGWSALGEHASSGDAVMNSMVQNWLSGCWKRSERKDGDDKIQRFAPSMRTVTEVVTSMRHEVELHGVLTGQAWLPKRRGDDGRPRFGMNASIAQTAGHSAERMAVARRENRPEARNLLCYRNGLLDISKLRWGAKVSDAWSPPSGQLFTLNTLPYDLPVEDLQALMDSRGANMGVVIERLAPKFTRFLMSASLADRADTEGKMAESGRWITQFRQMMGDTLDFDRSIEKVFMMLGPPRAGKGVACKCIGIMLGIRNVCFFDFADWLQLGGIAPSIGKRAAVSEDAHISKQADSTRLMEILKKASGQGTFNVRKLYSDPIEGLNWTARVWLAVNNMLTTLKDSSAAWGHRVVVLPFTRSHLGSEDESIKQGLEAEGEGIHLFGLLGLIELRNMERRQIEVCELGEDARAEYQDHTSQLSHFVRECCLTWPIADEVAETVEPGLRALLPMSLDTCCEPFDDVHRVYSNWCRCMGHQGILGKPNFSASIRPLVPAWHYRELGGVGMQSKRVGGARVRMAPGIKLRPDLDPALRYGEPEPETADGYPSPFVGG